MKCKLARAAHIADARHPPVQEGWPLHVDAHGTSTAHSECAGRPSGSSQRVGGPMVAAVPPLVGSIHSLEARDPSGQKVLFLTSRSLQQPPNVQMHSVRGHARKSSGTTVGGRRAGDDEPMIQRSHRNNPNSDIHGLRAPPWAGAEPHLIPGLRLVRVLLGPSALISDDGSRREGSGGVPGVPKSLPEGVREGPEGVLGRSWTGLGAKFVRSPLSELSLALLGTLLEIFWASLGPS